MITPVMPTYARAPMTFVEGSGSWLIDQDGSRYLDMGAGIAVNALGHAHPALISALEGQARRLWHTSNLYNVENQMKLADRLVELTFGDTVFFTNSGTEAMECAVKMARKYHSAKGAPERHRVISFEGSFHGRSLGMISAAGGDKLVNGFGPLLPGFDILPFADHDAVEAAITDETAAILIEPVQGEGGIRPIPLECMRGLRALCDKHGLLLILDEIQVGMGRAGRLFAHELAGITPDIMAVAKGIGGGFPLGCCIATEEAAIGMVPGTHGSTYGGNPLACAVGLAVLEEVAKPEFLENVSRLAGRLDQGLQGLVASHPDIFELTRGEGLMRCLKCKVPNMDVVHAGYDQELLLVPGGDNVVRILPPLNLSAEDLDEALARIDRAAGALETAG